MIKKYLALFTGVLFMGFGLSLCYKTSFGVAPFNAFCISIANLFNIDVGLSTLLCQLVLLIIVFVFNKKLINIGTIYATFSLGYYLDFFDNLLKIHVEMGLNVKAVIIYILGLLILSFGTALYIQSYLGVNPYDGFTIVMQEKTKLSFGNIKVVIDTTTTFLAFLLQGPVSGGTIFCMIFLGPIIAFFRKLIAKYILV